ncbi:MAG: restriction endonuclease subunit S, partial [Gammaproteobacteria bacterium]|nr:restriction endonuclease subunit S [Gammaproteobacteria bacterium]MBU1553529.1 restriction endonuclease subunit S [Gammaproteobacteria bacterium]
GVPTLNRNLVHDELIPLPPLAEQKRIAAILDKADAIRRKRQQAIQLADDFLRAVFLEMFGDPVTNPKGFPVGTIRELVETANYGSSAKASEEIADYPMLRMGNITYEGALDMTSLKYISLSETDKPKYLVSKSDLLFNRTNSKELVGKTTVYDLDEPAAFAGYLIRVRTNAAGNTYYLSAYLNSTHGKATLQNMCKSIVGMANINAQEMQNIPIMLPPIELQDKFSEIVIATKEKVKVLQCALNEQVGLFNVLSQRAFSGKL